MPFRNPIATIGGKLILGSLQSPDFNYNPSPSFSITGWKIDNSVPSSIYSKNMLANSMRVPVGINALGKYYDFADVADTNNAWTAPVMAASISAVRTTTTFQDSVTGLGVPIPPGGRSTTAPRINAFFNVRAALDINTIAAPGSAVAVGSLRVTPVVSGSPGSAVLSTRQAVFRGTAVNSRATVYQEWMIGLVSGADYMWTNNNTNYLYFDLAVRQNTGSASYTVNATHTALFVTPYMSVIYSG